MCVNNYYTTSLRNVFELFRNNMLCYEFLENYNKLFKYTVTLPYRFRTFFELFEKIYFETILFLYNIVILIITSNSFRTFRNDLFRNMYIFVEYCNLNNYFDLFSNFSKRFISNFSKRFISKHVYFCRIL